MKRRTLLPRITTSFSPDVHAAILTWGRARGLRTPSEILRSLAVVGLGAQQSRDAQAYASAREQALAELRARGRAILVEIAGRLP